MLDSLLAVLAVVLLTPWYGRVYLHVLQLEGYKPNALGKWLLRSGGRAIVPPAAVGVAAYLVGTYLHWGTAAVLTAGLAAWGWLEYRVPTKKPLVWTPRAKRLCAGCAVVFGLAAWAQPALAVALLPLLVWLAGWAAWPVERAVNRWYFNDARRTLASRTELIRIGITGSYGKTSAKFILATLLSERYKVQATPSSFNTPMGLSKVIRKELSPEHEVFIAEMGAKHRGDIAELCDLVRPEVGIVTSIGYQHLETFGNIETVAATKYELIESLPPQGVAVFAADDGGWSDRLYGRKKPQKGLRAGLSAGLDGLPLDMTAKDLRVGAYGSQFTLAEAGGGEIECRTKLLGYHNIGNILLCAAAARALGLTMEELARGIAKIEPIEHRLQILPSPSGLIVIDDAFNANPAGTRAALEVLSRFEKRKIIITPGLVELGEQEDKENHAFGRAIAAVCDEAILVGTKRAQIMRQGLIDADYPEERIHIVETLEAATALLSGLAGPGDAVLFENDLPDHMET